jgi:hypothetical protein
MEIISSPLPALSIDVGDASLQRDPQARLAQGSPAQSATTTQAGAVPPSTSGDTIAQTLLARLATAAARQDGITLLLSDLAQTLPLPQIPTNVRKDMARIMVLAEPLIKTGTTAPSATQPPDTVRPIAVGAIQTNLDPSAIRPQALPAITEAIERLQTSLRVWQPETAASLPPPQRAAATPSSPAPAGVTQSANLPVATQVQASSSPSPAPIWQQIPAPPQVPRGTPTETPPTGQPVASASSGPPPAEESAQVVAALGAVTSQLAALPQPQRPAQGTGLADALVSLLVAQQPVATAQETARRQRSPGQLPPGNDPDPQALSTSAALSAYRKAMPTRAHGQPVPWPSDPSPALIARTLMQRAETALAQTRVLEVATQVMRNEQTASPPHPTAPTQWNFDLPLATPVGQALVRFEIDRHAQGARDETPEVIWRARLSLDIEPLGPVHAQIALRGAKAWVSLWAERAETAQLLETQKPLLRQTLGAEALEADILLQAGGPTGEPVHGGTIRDASA